MRRLRVVLWDIGGAKILAPFLVILILNNILVPEMESPSLRKQGETIANSNLLELVMENIYEEELFDEDDNDDSSDNLIDVVNKYFYYNSFIIPQGFNYKLISHRCKNFYLATSLGFLNTDTPPPKQV
ncbi:hypothetical protein JKA74_13115 [Marivirga sp. S37H4]|uniref:Uncharacterized protein n=1 Tax=Marivirga aurantiaca TaxID=2802615 RepID=A0A935C955_9BACT|nr:hypothetical protein [Marivirga aurantiaca]MBK6265976.1 hypothetical protein [Marivirga aurantiaca]